MAKTPDQKPDNDGDNEPSAFAYRLARWAGKLIPQSFKDEVQEGLNQARGLTPEGPMPPRGGTAGDRAKATAARWAAQHAAKPGTERPAPAPYSQEKKDAATMVLLLMHELYKPGASIQRAEASMDEAKAKAFRNYYVTDVNERLEGQSGKVVIAEEMHATTAGHGSRCRHCGTEFTGGFLSKIVAAEDSSDLSISSEHFYNPTSPLVTVIAEPKGNVETFTYTPLDEHYLIKHDQTPDAVRVVNDLAPIADYHGGSVEVEHPNFKVPPSHPPTIPMPDGFK